MYSIIVYYIDIRDQIIHANRWFSVFPAGVQSMTKRLVTRGE